MSTLQEISNEAEFKAATSTSPATTIVLYFYATWAAPCAQMRTIITTLASQYPTQSSNTIFLSINAEDLPEISESYDVIAVPYLIIQRDGKELETMSGSDASKVRDIIERHAGKSGNVAKAGIPPQLEVTPRADNEGLNGTSGAQTTNGTKDLSGYAPSSKDPATAPDMSSGASSKEELHTRLANLVKAAPVMLFMKGTPSIPQCGFSRQLVSILRENGVKYGFFNILADEEVRQGLKEWADWPTFPQLWVGGDLVGGLDIVKEEITSNPDFFKDYAVPTATASAA